MHGGKPRKVLHPHLNDFEFFKLSAAANQIHSLSREVSGLMHVTFRESISAEFGLDPDRILLPHRSLPSGNLDEECYVLRQRRRDGRHHSSLAVPPESHLVLPNLRSPLEVMDGRD